MLEEEWKAALAGLPDVAAQPAAKAAGSDSTRSTEDDDDDDSSGDEFHDAQDGERMPRRPQSHSLRACRMPALRHIFLPVCSCVTAFARALTRALLSWPDEDSAGGKGGEDGDATVGTLPSSVVAQWNAAAAEGWDTLSALAEDNAFRKRLKKAETSAAKGVHTTASPVQRAPCSCRVQLAACAHDCPSPLTEHRLCSAQRLALRLLESVLGIPCTVVDGSAGGAGGGSITAGSGTTAVALQNSVKRGSLVALGATAVLAIAGAVGAGLGKPVYIWCVRRPHASSTVCHRLPLRWR